MITFTKDVRFSEPIPCSTISGHYRCTATGLRVLTKTTFGYEPHETVPYVALRSLNDHNKIIGYAELALSYDPDVLRYTAAILTNLAKKIEADSRKTLPPAAKRQA